MGARLGGSNARNRPGDERFRQVVALRRRQSPAGPFPSLAGTLSSFMGEVARSAG
ncbi:hypothetical protein FHR51_001682 [Xanthomonas arboricola]|nr:hypothetical protein [Xanthomonas cannabis]